jgi:hypothetical protein
MTNPDADVRLGDVFDFEGVPRAPRRHCDIVAIPAMEIGLAGIAQLRKALDEGEPGIREYLARTAGQDVQPEPGADLPEACAYHSGEGDGWPACPGCREEQDPFGASAFRGPRPGCGCPDCEGARRDAADDSDEDEDEDEMFSYPVPLGDDAARLLGY